MYERLMELEEAAKTAKRGIHSNKVRAGGLPAGGCQGLACELGSLTYVLTARPGFAPHRRSRRRG